MESEKFKFGIRRTDNIKISTKMANPKITSIPEDNEVGQIIHNEMTGKLQGRYVTIDEDGTVLPERYAVYADSIENFEVRDSDVWVCTFPRSGTTWMQEMAWLIGNNLDYEGANVSLLMRFPYLENSIMFDMKMLTEGLEAENEIYPSRATDYLNDFKTQRFIKSHLPFGLLPKEIRNGSKSPKIIYVMRNPKDVCVSLYHLYILALEAKTTIENFVKVFLDGKVIYGSYWKHIFGFWEKRGLPNVLIIKYEDMKSDLKLVIQKVAKFLNKDLTNQQIDQLQKHLGFESMKKNMSVNAELFLQLARYKKLFTSEGDFIRTGIVGKYKEELSPETIAELDAWIKNNIAGTSFGEEYNYDL